jgi:Ring finger domain
MNNNVDTGTSTKSPCPSALLLASRSGCGDPGDSSSRKRVDVDSIPSRGKIPHVCLAMAKDSRYLAHHELLLMRLSNGWNLSLSEPTQKLLATILVYGPLLVTRQRPATVGMDSCGVVFADNFISQRKRAIASIGLAALFPAAKSYLDNCTTAKNLESFKGQSRRALFELQREEMMHRSARRQPQSIPKSSEQNHFQSLRNSALRLLVDCYKAISSTSPGFGGPHIRAGDESWDDTPQSIILWLVRFHSAMYFINGQYPTLLHRLFNIKLHSRSGTAAGASTLQADYAMGMLLASLSLGVLFKIAVKTVLERVSSSREVSRHARNTASDAPSTDLSSTTSKLSRTCMICGGVRRHPSCSIRCGHVFCWNCLHRWIQTRANACPFCRTPCTTQDVVYLQNYDA